MIDESQDGEIILISTVKDQKNTELSPEEWD